MLLCSLAGTEPEVQSHKQYVFNVLAESTASFEDGR